MKNNFKVKAFLVFSVGILFGKVIEQLEENHNVKNADIDYNLVEKVILLNMRLNKPRI